MKSIPHCHGTCWLSVSSPRLAYTKSTSPYKHAATPPTVTPRVNMVYNGHDVSNKTLDPKPYIPNPKITVAHGDKQA